MLITMSERCYCCSAVVVFGGVDVAVVGLFVVFLRQVRGTFPPAPVQLAVLRHAGEVRGRRLVNY